MNKKMPRTQEGTRKRRRGLQVTPTRSYRITTHLKAPQRRTCPSGGPHKSPPHAPRDSTAAHGAVLSPSGAETGRNHDTLNRICFFRGQQKIQKAHTNHNHNAMQDSRLTLSLSATR